MLHVFLSDEAAQKKLKIHSDQFRLELKKVLAGKSGDPGLPLKDYRSMWPWFRMLFFLMDQIQGRATTENLSFTPAKKTKKNSMRRQMHVKTPKHLTFLTVKCKVLIRNSPHQQSAQRK